MASTSGLRKTPFLSGVFLISFSSLLFQILQTRIMSVIAWYYMAFFAISVAMLGMTVGAVGVYLWRDRFQPAQLPVTLSNFAFLTALAMPASIILQFCLITVPALSLTTVVSWGVLLTVMAVPYVFAGVVVSLALTRSPFPTGLVYSVDLLGAALGCIAVLLLLNVLDAPTAVIVAGAISGLSSFAFAISAGDVDRQRILSMPWWRNPGKVVVLLFALAYANSLSGVGFRPILVKGNMETVRMKGVQEKWNSYSRVTIDRPLQGTPPMWGLSPKMPADTVAPVAVMKIDGEAGTTAMFHYDGTPNSNSYLQYDLVNLAYHLPDVHKSAVIGVGGGRDVLSAHLFGVTDITGVELNPIFHRSAHARTPITKTFQI